LILNFLFEACFCLFTFFFIKMGLNPLSAVKSPENFFERNLEIIHESFTFNPYLKVMLIFDNY